MYSTPAYLYQQIQKVLLIDTSGLGATFQRRWNPVYAKKITINKGVDNVLLFEFVNQDQKPVNITGSDFVFRLIDTAGTDLFYETNLVTLNAATGRAKVTIRATETAGFPAEPASYSIERSSGILNEAVFVDAQSGGRGMVDIVDSVFPEFVPSQDLTIPTIYGPENYFNPVNAGNYPDWALNPPIANTNIETERFTSQVPTTGESLTTFQLSFVNFTGNIKAQAADDYQSGFYDVTSVYSYANNSDPAMINVVGYHPLLRLAIDQYSGQSQVSVATAQATVVAGAVTAITVTNSGAGYLAPPNVTITGTGSRARAQSVIQNGQVVAINVIDGGSGYVPDPSTNIAAAVSINNGFITDIVYR